MTKNILIIGATSGIAESVARIYAQQGCQLFLVARNAKKLEVVVNDLKARGATSVHAFKMDANDTSRWPEMADAAWAMLKKINAVLVAHGTLPDQNRCETELNYAVTEFRTNAESIITCLTVLAERFEQQASGTIAVIGSVAGDRGRSSNYLYGAAKAAIDAFTSGLRGRMFRAGVHVLTIKPGFVDTPMTQDLSLPQILLVSPDKVAADIVKAVNKGQDVLYTPWFWRWVMIVITVIPSAIFKKIKL